MKKPNIILITTDQMRGDCLGIAGHPDVKTPYLDTLAARGTLFTNAYTACPTCIPARAALLTGMSQKRHGRVGYEDGVPWDYPHMLPQVLADNGYHTECIGKMHVHPPLLRCGFHDLQLHDGYLRYYRGPDIPYFWHQHVSDSYIQWLREKYGPAADVTDPGVECNSWVARPWIYDEMSHPTNWVVTRSLDFLRARDRSLPFFLHVSFVRPHPPFDAPAVYFDMYRDRDLRPPALGDWEEDDSQSLRGRMYDAGCGSGDAELRRQAMIGYYACITQVDHQIGRLLQRLDEERVLDDTVIVFTSDHGELLFDHHMFRKTRMYQGSVHVPLVVKPGRNIPWELPQQTDRLTELRDIMPSLLGLAGIDVPDTVDGMDFAQQPGESREYLHCEHANGELSAHCIVTRSEKYIWYSQTGLERLFDLESDPCEEHDLIKIHPERAARLRERLIAELTGREEGYSDGKNLIIGRTPVNILAHLLT